MHVHDGVVLAVVQAKDHELDPVQVGQDDGRGGVAVVRRCRPCFPVLILGEHAEPGSGQGGGGRRGDAVAGDVQPRAQRGELAGNRAGWGQGGALLQRRYHLTESVGQAGERPGPWRGPVQPGVVREGRHGRQQPGRDRAQQVLAGAGCRRADRHVGASWRPDFTGSGQDDARGGPAAGGGQVQPPRIVRRVRAQHEGPPEHRAADVADGDLVPGPLVVDGGERVEKPRTRWLPPAGPLTCPREHAELRAARHPRVRQQADLAPGICAANPHYLPERNRRVRLPGGRPGTRPARR
jgi:hypothetical protein